MHRQLFCGTMNLSAVRVAVCAGAIYASACSPDFPAPRLADTTSVAPMLVVSKVVPVTTSLSGQPSVQAAVGTLSYVSAPPGTANDGVTAVIRNRNGDATVTAYMFGGGFDPTPVVGSTGDTIEVTMRGITGLVVLSVTAAIPAKRRPIVIRTSPSRGKRAVPLNSTITVVFSDPMDPQAVNGANLRLQSGGQTVSGQLTLDPSGTRADFVPQDPLVANTVYTIELKDGLVDLTAEPLQAMAIDFTTAPDDLSRIAMSACVGPSVPEQACGIHVVSANGAGFAALTSLPGTAEREFAPTWSVDGRKIAFSSRRHCAISGVPPAAGTCPGAIYVMNTDGSGITKLTTLDTSDSLYSEFAAWSPNGTRIAFSSYRLAASGASPFHALYLVNPDGSGLRRIGFSTDTSYGRPAWSPDGSQLVFGLYGPAGSHHGLHIADTNGTIITRVTTQNDAFPSWSPDGTRIAFQRKHPGATPAEGWHHIHVIQPDGQNDVQLTTGGGNPALNRYTPTWAPDGSRIAFIYSSNSPSPSRVIHVIDPDGSNLDVLTIPWLSATLPAWSPFGAMPER